MSEQEKKAWRVIGILMAIGVLVTLVAIGIYEFDKSMQGIGPPCC